MRPSISMTLEPGLERGVPWGRDLYTFVTSAAGHMMRTLQKPRKNRPSKRQVNHRRFLHNMIQRKFSDIEAANQRLTSSLYLKEDEKISSSPPPQTTLDQSGSPQESPLPDPDTHTGSDVGSHGAEISERKQPDSAHLWERHPKPQPTSCTAAKNNQSKEIQNEESIHQLSSSLSSISSPKGPDYHHGAELLQTDCYDDERRSVNLSEDSQTPQQDCAFSQNMDVSPPFSPGLAPLSLDSCDFSIQMLTDISACLQAQKSSGDISESQWTDSMDLFSVSSRDLGGSMDVEAYFESICACHGDAGQEVAADDVGCADQSDRSISRSTGATDECEYQYSCRGNRELTINHFQSDEGSLQAQNGNEDALETQLQMDIIQNELPASISFHYNASELQTYQHPQDNDPSLLASCEKYQNVTPFEGIAQSFSIPLYNPEHRPMPILPHEDDWLFTDILKDGTSPSCQGDMFLKY